MTMNLRLLSTLATVLATVILSPLAAVAGTNTGGGGQGVVCRDNNGSVTSAEVLDLYELEHYYALKFEVGVNGTYLTVAKHYADVIGASMPQAYPVGTISESDGTKTRSGFELNSSLYLEHQRPNDMRDLVTQIDKEKVIVPGDSMLPPAGDSHPRVLPGNRACAIEQIAYYTDGNDQLHIVGQVWQKMDSRNKAALLVHEAIYRTLRGEGETTSDHTRKIVAYLFHGMKTHWLLESLPNKFVSCWSKDVNHSFQFVVYPNTADYVTAQFLVYDGQVVVNRARINVAAEPFAQSLGIPATTPSATGGFGEMNTIHDPLLERPDYTFLFEKAADGSLQTYFALHPEKNGVSINSPENQIECEEGLTTITLGADGSVSKDSGLHRH